MVGQNLLQLIVNSIETLETLNLNDQQRLSLIELHNSRGLPTSVLNSLEDLYGQTNVIKDLKAKGIKV